MAVWEGGLHVVDVRTGIEQTVFVPSEILNNPDASRVLRFGEAGQYNMVFSGAWIADPAYKRNEVRVRCAVCNCQKNECLWWDVMGGKLLWYGFDESKKTRIDFLELVQIRSRVLENRANLA